MRTNRRALLTGGAVAAAVGAPDAAAQIWPFRRREAQALPVQHSSHGAHEGHGGASAPALSAEEQTLIRALMQCDVAGQTCLTHCIALMAGGDVSVAECANAVRTTLAVCEASRTLVQTQSSLVAAQLGVCRDACTACAAACQPHVAHHATCRACAESCTAAVAAIDALLR